MRFVLTLCCTLLFVHPLFSQQAIITCDSLVKVELDSATGAYSKISEDIIISKNGKDVLTFVFLVMDRTVVLSVTANGGVYCIDETNTIDLKFRDGSKLEMKNNGKFNCDGDFSLFFYGPFGNKKEFEQLMTREIEHVKVGLRKSVVEKTRENFIEAVFPPEKSKLFMQIMACLVE